MCTMAVDSTPGPRRDGAEPPKLPPGGPVSPTAPTVRVNPAAPAAGASPVVPRAAPFTPPVPSAPVVSASRTITTRLAEAAATARRYKPPAPLTNPLRHPLRWLVITVVSVAAAVIFAHLGALFITGLYYLIFQVNSSAAAWWHSVIPDAALRHTVRDVAEGFYGGAIAQQLVWNQAKEPA
jgi:hypothetical protein